MTCVPTTRLTAYEAPTLRCKLVPVQVRTDRKHLDRWNVRVRDWHRAGGA